MPKRLLALITTAALSLACLHAQTSGSSDRVASAGRLWAAIKYFHPWLAYRDVNWTAAWASAYPDIKAARNGEEYKKAINEMLAALGDPLTKVATESSPTTADGGHITSRWERDSILVVTVPHSSDWAGMTQEFVKVTQELLKAKTLVFDLRDASEESVFAMGQTGIDRALSKTPVTAPGERRRFHSGLATEASTSGMYYSGFNVQQGARFEPLPKAMDITSIFVVSNRTMIPPVALALQAAGKALIIGEGAAADLVTTTTITLADGLKVNVRLGELLFPDGTVGYQPELSVPEGQGLKAALDAAAKPLNMKQADRPRPQVVPSQSPAPKYPDDPYPTPAYRALAAVQVWANHEYFYPYKKLMNEDWTGVLNEFVPRLEAATDAREYQLGVSEMLTHVHDTHSGAYSKTLAQFNEAVPPLVLRWIENAPVVTQIRDKDLVANAGIAIGDAIVAVDGTDVSARVKELSKYASASTPQALMWKVCSNLLAGVDGSQVALQVRKPDGAVRTASLPRKREYRTGERGLGGEIIRILPENIGYADLNRLTVPMVDAMFEKFRDMRAIIFDMRGYPNGTAWAIAPRLTEKKSLTAALFSRPVATTPEPGPGYAAEATTYSFAQPIPPTDKWRYKGQTVMLMDERTISQAEHTGLFFEAANGTKFVGTPTSGANGDVTTFSLPGGIRVGMTGHDVRHADGRQLQRVGLRPDVEVAPTIVGIAAGRDEVLERAVEFIKSGK